MADANDAANDGAGAPPELSTATARVSLVELRAVKPAVDAMLAAEGGPPAKLPGKLPSTIAVAGANDA